MLRKFAPGKLRQAKAKMGCRAIFKDVDRLAEDDCPYYFDAEAVVDFYEWSRQFNHVEGILAGQPIELTDFQLLLRPTYTDFIKENGARRFRKAYIQLARKNAKSQF
ncbi:hypothetical protein [Bacillus velezensis]|uniref:hypothetical protein n=1 Tax=Bacillus velezensis TaxID=492670 RepID=UPI001E5EDED8|nr:hypothetical protein [Bacillus velezensis]